jgi:hypothetical protein
MPAAAVKISFFSLVAKCCHLQAFLKYEYAEKWGYPIINAYCNLRHWQGLFFQSLLTVEFSF